MRTKRCARRARWLAAGIVAGAAGLALAACSESPPPAAPAASVPPHGDVQGRTSPGQRGTSGLAAGLDPVKVARGGEIYKANCAACHGANAGGAPNWQRKDPDGRYPAPPLDGTGHDWHHPKSALVQTIKEGTLKLGGNMPAWKGTLSDDDIEAVLSWIQSRWPAEIYENWKQMDEKARRGLVRH